MSHRILVVTTSVSEYQDSGLRTGLWLGELTHFVDEITKVGIAYDIASVMGGDVPIDPESLTVPMLALGGTGKRYKSRRFMDDLQDTRSVQDVVPEDYDAIYLTGGHGTMFDFTKDEGLISLVREFAEQGRIVSSVCHGASGLLEVELDGRPLVFGKKVTGYSWTEEKLARRADVVPFSLEEALAQRGGRYLKHRFPMAPFVVTDGNLVTGQNPSSAKAVAKAVIAKIQAR